MSIHPDVAAEIDRLHEIAASPVPSAAHTAVEITRAADLAARCVHHAGLHGWSDEQVTHIETRSYLSEKVRELALAFYDTARGQVIVNARLAAELDD